MKTQSPRARRPEKKRTPQAKLETLRRKQARADKYGSRS